MLRETFAKEIREVYLNATGLTESDVKDNQHDSAFNAISVWHDKEMKKLENEVIKSVLGNFVSSITDGPMGSIS